MSKNVTIKDVAHHAKVSISTVSRVINSTGSVNEVLRERVLSAINELKYSPNVIAQGLRGNSMHLVAYIVSNTADPFFTYISRGVEDVLYDNGYNLINCSTFSSLDRENTFLRTLSERRVDGFIINTVGKNDSRIADISSSFPVVLSNRAINNPAFSGDLYDFDSEYDVEILTRRILELGHRKIAFLTGPNYLSTATERLSGYLAAMNGAGINAKPSHPYVYISENSFSLEDGYIAASKIMSLPDPPTALIAANSEMALGAMKYCRKHNIRIPEDVSICCYGNILHSDLMCVNVTHMHMDLVRFGNRLAKMLLERIESKNSLRPREIRSPTVYVEGNSTAAPRNSTNRR